MKYFGSLFFMISIAFFVHAQDTQKIGILEHLDEVIPKDIKLVNTNGDTVLIGDIITKPTVLNFVYFRCPGICTPLMDGLAEVVNSSDLKLGEDYQILTISFDYTETYDLALKKGIIIPYRQKEGMENGWLFFSSDSLNITRLTTAAGFSFKRTGNDFIHTAGLILLSPEGKITRYLNGTYFLPFEFKLAVIESSKGIPGPTVNRILQFCYSYDPVGQSYVLNITKLAGVLILFIGVLLFIVLTVKPKRKETKSN